MDEVELLRLARRQYGVISRADAVSAIGAEGVRWRLERKRWKRVHPGVYQVDTGDLPWLGRAQAALVHAGEGALLTLQSAAYVHGFVTKAPAIITVAVPTRRAVLRVPGVRIRRRRGLVGEVVKRLCVTSAADTVLDLAAVPGVTWREAIAGAADAVRETTVTADDVAHALAARRAHPHRRAFELALGVVAQGAQSGLEVSFVVDVLRAHGLPEMRMQVPAETGTGRIRRDFEHVATGLVAEVDGRLGHEGSGRQADNRRDRQAAREGKVTLRAGWNDVIHDACDLALDLHGAMVARGLAPCLKACGPGCGLNRRRGSA